MNQTSAGVDGDVAIPEVAGSAYRWSLGDVSLEVDATRGARIVAFRHADVSVLTGPAVNELNFGSTFWTSPQSQWGWPPIVEIDSEPYTVSGQGADVSFASRSAPALGVRVTKCFRARRATKTFAITYEIANDATEPRTIAPWEISRVFTGGLTFFPSGDGIEAPSNLAVKLAAGMTWFDYDAKAITDHQKLFAHGAGGFLAHVDRAHRLMFVKTFPEIGRAEQAPGEAQVELYADPAHTYVEVEEQGAYATLAPGGRSSWTVGWKLLPLPSTLDLRLDPTAGNAALVGLAQAAVTTMRGT